MDANKLEFATYVKWYIPLEDNTDSSQNMIRILQQRVCKVMHISAREENSAFHKF